MRGMRVIAGLFAIVLVLAACGGDGGGDGGEPTGATGATGATEGGGEGTSISIAGFAFNPSTITVSGPTEVTISNNDSAPHTFTLDDESVDEEIGPGESVTVTVDVSASTGFFCRFHGNMQGSVEVA
jgi:plastocyanin